MHPVGRLDYDTSGLLLFSSSGALTQRLLHPKHEVEKEYVAVVTGIVVEDELRATLAAGVQTTEGSHKATLESVDIWERSSIAPYLLNIQRNFPPEYNQTDLKVRGYLNVFDAQALSTVRLTVSEGKHRMVRRILANCGHPVVSLHRDRLGAVALNDLPAGEYRPLTTEESPWAETLVPLEKKHIKPKPKTSRKQL
jgi:23S rRNA pseudouridine2605 synthase